MSIIQNLIEYYDELFPVTEGKKSFYNNIISQYKRPVKFLRIECGTGLFESQLSREGHDVTGIESCPEILRSANLRRRTQLMSIRFFQMSYLDMTKFLGTGFYDVVSCLDSKIISIHDKTLMEKFFYDCKNLLAERGTFILEFLNFDLFSSKPMANLPTKESLRAKLFTEMWTQDNGKQFVTQNLETGNGKMLPVLQDEPVCSIKIEEVESFAKKAGFSSVEFYSDFNKNPFTGKEENIVAVIKK